MNIVLMSKRPGEPWMFRNRFPADNAEANGMNHDKRAHAFVLLRAKAQRFIIEWSKYEPETEFQVEDLDRPRRAAA